MAAGFNSPSIVFLGTWDAPERLFMIELLKASRERYPVYHEPVAGILAMSMVAKSAGYDPRKFVLTDVGLAQTLVARAVQNRGLDDLGIVFDDEPFVSTRDPHRDAAIALWFQLVVRFERREGAYNQEMCRDLHERKEAFLASFIAQTKRLAEHLQGFSYEPMDLFKHLESVADLENVILCLNPPSYKGAYEKFYETDGRIRWNAPEYTVFDAEAHHPKINAMIRDMKPLIVVQEMQKPLRCAGDPIWARHQGKDVYTYIYSNRSDEVRATLGKKCRAWALPDYEPLKRTLVPYDYVPTEKSTIAVERILPKNADYYRNLWIHKVETKGASQHFALYIDGYLAGVGAYDYAPMLASYSQKWDDALLLTYSCGAPNKHTLTKLIVMYALTRECVDAIALPQYAARCNRVITAEFSPKHEQKGLRGIMKLASRTKEKHGFKLIYAAEVKDESFPSVVKRWVAKEAARGKMEASA